MKEKEDLFLTSTEGSLMDGCSINRSTHGMRTRELPIKLEMWGYNHYVAFILFLCVSKIITLFNINIANVK
jgi:hypothetical protein